MTYKSNSSTSVRSTSIISKTFIVSYSASRMNSTKNSKPIKSWIKKMKSIKPWWWSFNMIRRFWLKIMSLWSLSIMMSKSIKKSITRSLDNINCWFRTKNNSKNNYKKPSHPKITTYKKWTSNTINKFSTTKELAGKWTKKPKPPPIKLFKWKDKWISSRVSQKKSEGTTKIS